MIWVLGEVEERLLSFLRSKKEDRGSETRQKDYFNGKNIYLFTNLLKSHDRTQAD